MSSNHEKTGAIESFDCGLSFDPGFDDGRSKAPEFAHLNRVNLAAVNEPLQGPWMHPEDGCGLVAVEQWFLD